MNEFKINDLQIGMKESFKRRISDEMMEQFYRLSGDDNPLHTDEVFAKEKGFRDRVVYGMLSASFISTMGGCYLPGKYCLIQGVEVRFAKPVFVGDEIEVTGEVSKVDTDLNYCEIKISAKNQYGDKVLRGLLKAGVIYE